MKEESAGLLFFDDDLYDLFTRVFPVLFYIICKNRGQTFFFIFSFSEDKSLLGKQNLRSVRNFKAGCLCQLFSCLSYCLGIRRSVLPVENRAEFLSLVRVHEIPALIFKCFSYFLIDVGIDDYRLFGSGCYTVVECFAEYNITDGLVNVSRAFDKCGAVAGAADKNVFSGRNSCFAHVRNSLNHNS